MVSICVQAGVHHDLTHLQLDEFLGVHVISICFGVLQGDQGVVRQCGSHSGIDGMDSTK